MNDTSFHDEIALAAQAEGLAKQAMKLGLIPSFTVHHFPDRWQFYIPDFNSKLLTPAAAYLQLKHLIQSKHGELTNDTRSSQSTSIHSGSGS